MATVRGHCLHGAVRLGDVLETRSLGGTLVFQGCLELARCHRRRGGVYICGTSCRCFAYLFFSIPLFALLFSPSTYCSGNSDPRSHSRLFSPLATTVRALHFHREKTSALSSRNRLASNYDACVCTCRLMRTQPCWGPRSVATKTMKGVGSSTVYSST